MNPATAEFVELCITHEVLRFGEFTLKSGRISPYFFDTGRFNHGALLSQLARHYARLLVDKLQPTNTERIFMLYGPAYKGIPLAAATAVQLADQHHLNIGYAFHRKEAKQHGEGGNMVGAALRGEVVIIDDVITSGTSIRQSVAAIQAAGAHPHSVVIALDRQEIADHHTRSAAQQVAKEHGIAVYPLLTLHDLIEHLAPREDDNETTSSQIVGKYSAAIRAYRKRYGIA